MINFKRFRLAFMTLALAIAVSSSLFAEDKPKVKLYVMDCGYITANDLSMFSSEGYYKGEKKELSDSCYLIKHPSKGILLWDAGLSDGLAAKPEGVVAGGGAFTLKVKKTLSSQLAEIGVKPEDVTYIAFSHLHFDHTGNANMFTKATWLIQGVEYAAAFGPDAEKLFFDPASYNKLKEGKVVQLDGDHDVFSDGSVVIIAAPGHTPGHQVLNVNLRKEGPIVLSGDLYHFTKNRTFRRVPAFNYNKDESKTSIERVEDLVALKHAQLWIQHDLEQNLTIKHSPAYHE